MGMRMQIVDETRKTYYTYREEKRFQILIAEWGDGMRREWICGVILKKEELIV